MRLTLAQVSLGMKFAGMLSNHMPERLHRIVLLNPPRVFRMMLRSLKAFVDATTMAKLVPVTGNTDAIISTLRDEHCFPEPALAWLTRVLDAKKGYGAPLPPLPFASRALVMPSLIPALDFEPPTAEDEIPVGLGEEQKADE
jgi:hypothetical protein